MKVKILSVKEVKGQLRVKVEHDYGQEDIGLSLNAKFLDDTGQPRWKSEVKNLLNKKYGSRKADKSLPGTKLFKSEWGKTLDLDK